MRKRWYLLYFVHNWWCMRPVSPYWDVLGLFVLLAVCAMAIVMAHAGFVTVLSLFCTQRIAEILSVLIGSTFACSLIGYYIVTRRNFRPDFENIDESA